MPEGMHLKSDGIASSLYDSRAKFRLADYCREQNIPYQNFGLPVPLQVFSDYGQEFARRYVPMLEDNEVVTINQMAGGFDLVMADGKTVTTRHVICANGISEHAYIPEILRGLAGAKISHCSEHHVLSGFAGKTIAVLGGGASAADYAALLSQAGATTHLITRRARLAFHLGPHRRGLREKLRYPRSMLGPGWRSLLCAQLPLFFHAMPEARRLAITSTHLGPAPCWFVRDTVEKAVTVHTDAQITNVTTRDGRAELTIGGATPKTLAVDHIIAATGYRLNVAGQKCLDPKLSAKIQTDPTGAPKLSSWFESTVPGLYFTGTAAANAFGPLLRFACGAEFTASRLSRHFA